MTYRDLLATVQPAINVFSNGLQNGQIDYDGAETTAVRYAMIQNERALKDALQGTDMVGGYQGRLGQIAEEHVSGESLDVPPEKAVPLLHSYARSLLFPDVEAEADLPEDAEEAVEELLQEDAPFEPYQISEEDLMAEPGVPIELLGMVEGWLVEGE
jgi:hypothetical protein